MSPAPDSTLDDPQKIIADLQRANAELQRRLDERTHERDEALQREIATAEVLGVINSSPGDLAPVFDAILEKAHSLCGVATGALSLTDGGVARTMAIRGAPRAYTEAMGQLFRPPPESPIARIMQGAPFVQIPDM